jgi:NADPH-dependent 2,4-dienoyl-CoA reductase/sulfur reductase-like enzyme
MILVAVGAQPETALGRAAEVATGLKGALNVNRRMETNVPDIYAAGDCIATWHRITRSNAYLPLGITAPSRGGLLVRIGGEQEIEGSLDTQSVRLFDVVVARIGFHDRDAANADTIRCPWIP